MTAEFSRRDWPPRVRRLADVVRREERNVRPDELLGDIQQPVVADEPYPERIPGHELVAEILAAQLGMAVLEPGHVLAGLRYQTCIQHIPENDKAVPLVSPQRF